MVEGETSFNVPNIVPTHPSDPAQSTSAPPSRNLRNLVAAPLLAPSASLRGKKKGPLFGSSGRFRTSPDEPPRIAVSSEREGGPAASPRFHELLRQLGEEHDRSIQVLHKELGSEEIEYSSEASNSPEVKQSLSVPRADGPDLGNQESSSLLVPPKAAGPRASASAAGRRVSSCSSGREPRGRPYSSENDDQSASDGAACREERPKSRFRPSDAGRRPSTMMIAREVLPPTFCVLSAWRDDAVEMRYVNASPRMGVYSGEETVEFSHRGKGSMPCPVFLHPHSQKRLYWDLCGMLLLVQDLVMIPFQSAFGPQDSGFLKVVVQFALVFWTIDLTTSFFTGYQEKHGHIVMKPRKIALRYMRSWFILDVSLVTFDWLLLTVWAEQEDGNTATRLGRSLRTIRFMRSVRLLRVLKLKRIFKEIHDNIDSEVAALYWGIFRITVMILLANHFVACGWYSVGLASDDGSSDSLNWIRQNGLFDTQLRWRYTTSLHWSLTQFTPASMDVVAMCFAERAYTIVVVVFAMITFSSFVGTLTSNMTHLRNRNANETQQFYLLRCYLKELKVSKRTCVRVQRYLEYAWRRKKERIQEQDVKLLPLLSQPLSDAIKHESFAPHLDVHPLFQSTGKLSQTFTHCLQAVSLASKDLCFQCGQEADAMFIIVDGAFEYLLIDEDGQWGAGKLDRCSANSAVTDVSLSRACDVNVAPQTGSDNNSHTVLGSGQWICEPALWTHWVHLGDMRAAADSQLISIGTTSFGQKVRNDQSLWYVIHKYGQFFVEELNLINKEILCDVADRHFAPKAILQKAMSATSRNCQRISESSAKSDISDEVSSNLGTVASNAWAALTGQK